ncbi:hypothetical protein H2200_005998 [Cladophialophora chaetospira]|uniref:Uncharacterized protein n=1 Tax=Cladophialophora chaetospira TaxID=386627 RepID=A0AA38XAP8_9EURO|nr:hypothetical protein H2200_005998 [Cladophialophora chaetospira]
MPTETSTPPVSTMTEFLPELRYWVAEIIATEADHLYGIKQDEARMTLYALRLVCKDFANMGVVKAALFKSLNLDATWEDLRLVQATDLSFLAPYIRKVTIRPSLHNVDLDFMDFKCYYLSKVGKLLSDEEVNLEFESYQDKSRIDDTLMKSGELERVWTALFKQFRKSIKIVIPSWIGQHPLLFNWDEFWEAASSRIPLREGSLMNYKQLFRTVLRCLVSSDVIVRGIEADCEIMNSFRDWQSSDWRQLVLDKLKVLKFTSYEFWDAIEHDGFRERDNAIFNAIGQFLGKCPSDLRVLGIQRYVDCPRILIPSLSASGIRGLRPLSLEGILLGPHLLALDISSMLYLKSVYLRDCDTRPTEGQWKAVLVSVHHHTNSIRFEMDNCRGRRGDHEWDFFFSFNTATFDEDVACLRYEDERELYRYLARRGPWTNGLEICYG